MKKFEMAGVSRKDGKLALRASNREGDTYSVILKKDGHTDVHIVKLPHEMSKDEIRKHLPKLKYFSSNPEIMAMLKQEDGEEAPDKAKANTKAITKPKTSKPPTAKKAKAASSKGKKKEDAKAEPENDGSEVANAERHDDDGVDLAQELGQPAFAKHLAAE